MKQKRDKKYFTLSYIISAEIIAWLCVTSIQNIEDSVIGVYIGWIIIESG